MQSAGKAREILTSLYGLEFPDSLFLLHEFLTGLGGEEWQASSSALGMSQIGPLQILSLPEAELHRIRTTLPLTLHGRYYHDVPEFFSCLWGDQDFLHWGLLLDEPATGFRGAASYYGNDLEPMRVYSSLFAAILDRAKDRTSSFEPSDAEERAEHHRRQDQLHRFSEKIHRFIQDRQICLDESRGQGLSSDTGLGLIAEKGEGWFSNLLDWFSKWPRSDWSVFAPTGHSRIVHLGEMKKAEEIKTLVREAMDESEKGRALPALSLGRSLWFWNERRGMQNSSPYFGALAYDLLRRAYTLLDRPALVQILEAHHAHRNSDMVDLLKA